MSVSYWNDPTMKRKLDMIIEHVNDSNMSPLVKKTVISALLFTDGESMGDWDDIEYRLN